MNESVKQVWCVFFNEKSPNNRKLMSVKFAENEDYQKAYGFYVEESTSTNPVNEVKKESVNSSPIPEAPKQEQKPNSK